MLRNLVPQKGADLQSRKKNGELGNEFETRKIRRLEICGSPAMREEESRTLLLEYDFLPKDSMSSATDSFAFELPVTLILLPTDDLTSIKYQLLFSAK
ncbi:hypothetical protein V1477_001189 [Vespula maculifrons]|uniref:Uncharacterized protein n=1 Tax=Vespula maculifrons TaxID=7453 RepID=A0ABD2D0Y7_VESMC